MTNVAGRCQVKGPVNIQDQFLNRARRERLWIAVELVSGEKLFGNVIGFDNFCIHFKGAGEQLVYKHAVAFLAPTEREV